MGIQLRYELDKGKELKTFEHKGRAYEILGESPYRDLIPGPSFHVQKQYLAIASDGELYEVFVYYYSKFEDGRRMAVVDAIRPAEVSE